jgi:hypothetical protein
VLSASFVSVSAGWLLATPCADQVQTCRPVVMRETVDGGRTWFVAPAPDAPPADMFQGSPPTNAVGAVVFTGGGQGWAFGPALWQTRDGGATWQKMSVPGVGNQFKTAWLSGDGERNWREVASPPFGGYLDGASISPGGTIFLSGS